MIPANFEYESPRELSEVLALLAKREDAKILAGGHSLLPALKLRLAAPALLVDLSRVAGLNYIKEAGDVIRIGATTTHAEIVASGLLQARSPLLPKAAAQIGDIQVRNRGTIGGSLAHADPAADYPAVILALDAELVAMSQKGERTIAGRDFFTGLFSTALAGDELITEVRIPASNSAGTAYQKFSHPASGFAVVGVAVVARMLGSNIASAAVGITGVAQRAYRASVVERALANKPTSAIAEAAAHAAEGVLDALNDSFASAEYRRHLAAVYTRRALEEAVGGTGRR